MERIRNILKDDLGRSLGALDEVDRIAAAWVLVCGRMLADRTSVVDFRDGFLHVAVAGGTWLRLMTNMQDQLKSELSRIARVNLIGIHFELKIPGKTVSKDER